MLLLWQAKPQVTKLLLQEKAKKQMGYQQDARDCSGKSMVTVGSTISHDDTASITMQPVQTSTDANIVQATTPFQWMAVQLTGVAMSQV